MRARQPQPIPEEERGAAMLAALCLATVFALCLSSYIALCYNSLKVSTRSLMGSHCIELAETGLEQALYSQNNWDWSAPWNVHGATASLTLPAFSFENGATGLVNVSVAENTPKANWAQITSSGTVTLSDGTTVTRTLQCVCQPSSSFVNAAAATKGNVTFAQGGTLDSYDSSVGPYQPGGYSAVVLSGSAPPLYPTVLLNTAVVDGYAEGTGSNSVSYASTAEVIGPNTPSGTTIDPSRILTAAQPNQPVLPENLPTYVPPIKPSRSWASLTCASWTSRQISIPIGRRRNFRWNDEVFQKFNNFDEETGPAKSTLVFIASNLRIKTGRLASYLCHGTTRRQRSIVGAVQFPAVLRDIRVHGHANSRQHRLWLHIPLGAVSECEPRYWIVDANHTRGADQPQLGRRR